MRADRTGRRAPARAQLRDEALLLRRTPFGNSSLVVHLLTRSHGRVELVARGAYRAKSRFCGVLDWFDGLDLTWVGPRGGAAEGLGELRGGDLVTRRRNLTAHLPLYRAAQTMTELAEVATRAGAAGAEHHGLLDEGLGTLDRLGPLGFDGGGGDVGALAAACLAGYELRLLALLGVTPSLEACAVCGEAAPPVQGAGPEPRAAFSAMAGGRLCGRHAAEARAAGRRVGTMPTAVLGAAARLLGSGSLGKASNAARGTAQYPDLALRVLDFAARFFDHQLEGRARSHARFLGAPDRNRRQ